MKKETPKTTDKKQPVADVQAMLEKLEHSTEGSRNPQTVEILKALIGAGTE